MRIIDVDGNDIDNPDLVNGYLVNWNIIRKDITPIDDVVKFHYDEDDYEIGKMYFRYAPGEKEENAKIEEFNKRFQGGYPALCENQAKSDAALCELYEAYISIQGSTDTAVCELYELILGGK